MVFEGGLGVLCTPSRSVDSGIPKQVVPCDPSYGIVVEL